MLYASKFSLVSQLSWLDACDYDIRLRELVFHKYLYFRFDSCAVPMLICWADMTSYSYSFSITAEKIFLLINRFVLTNTSRNFTPHLLSNNFPFYKGRI